MLDLSQKQTVIIFEGPDMCGKTEIARALSAATNVPYFKNSADIGAFVVKNEDYFTRTLRYAEPFYTNFLKQTGYSIIMDRGYPSEFVYPRVFKRNTSMVDLSRVDEAYAALGTTIVLCVRSDYSGRKDDMAPDKINDEKMMRLHEAYVDFSNWTKCSVIMLNVDDENLHREVMEIVDRLITNNVCNSECVHYSRLT